METITNKSPLRYPGGKTRACKLLDNILRAYFSPDSFSRVISPFFGGGSFEFYLQSSYGWDILANDAFVPLATFWKVCKETPSDLVGALKGTPGHVDKATFAEAREEILRGDLDELALAKAYFVINRCSFSGATLSGGFSKQASEGRLTTSSVDRLGALNLTRFEIRGVDFEDFLGANPPGHQDFLFLDPPYCLEGAKSSLYGKAGDLHKGFNHERLRKILGALDNWMLTYNDCARVRELYEGYEIIEVNWKYGMNSTKKSSEIVIVCHRSTNNKEADQ